jgi:hypothetical protein
MNKRFKYLVLIFPGRIASALLLLVFISGCTRKPEEDKDILSLQESWFDIDMSEALKKRQDIPVSQIAEDLTYIPFETSESSLLGGRIHDVKFSDEYIFIDHNGTPLLTLYDWDGKFVRHIGTEGRGPGEYPSIREFTIDEENQLIFIQGNYIKKILVFSFEGEHIRSIQYEGVDRGSVVWVRDSCFLSFDEPSIGNEKYVFIETNSNGDTLQTIQNHCLWDNNQSTHTTISYPGRDVFYTFNNTLHFKGWYNDTIYTYSKNFRIIPKFFIDLKNLKLPDEFRVERYFRSVNKLSQEYYWTGVNETLNYIFIKYATYDFISDNGYILYDKKNRETIALKHNTGFYNDLNGGPDFMPQFTNDSLALQFIEAFEFKDYCSSDKFLNSRPVNTEQKEDLQRLNNLLKEDDNPVLVVARLYIND